MSEKFIPEKIDPFRYADQDLRLEGGVRLSDMPRLSANHQVGSEIASVKLHFGVDEQGMTFVKGHLEAQLSLQCQRCMDLFIYEIISNFVLGVVKTLDEANALPEQYESAVANEEGQLALRELIEDELILNLPLIPRHEPEACKVKLPLMDSGWTEGKGENPFKVLESLKHKHHQGE